MVNFSNHIIIIICECWIELYQVSTMAEYKPRYNLLYKLKQQPSIIIPLGDKQDDDDSSSSGGNNNYNNKNN